VRWWDENVGVRHAGDTKNADLRSCYKKIDSTGERHYGHPRPGARPTSDTREACCAKLLVLLTFPPQPGQLPLVGSRWGPSARGADGWPLYGENGWGGGGVGDLAEPLSEPRPVLAFYGDDDD
jgi:hypothetical protein